MIASLKKLLADGLPPSLLCVLMLLQGCATPPIEVPVAVKCPEYPQINKDMLKPVPTQYLLPKELQRTAPKQP